MGGFGSGRWQDGKRSTDEVRSLDVRQLQRDGLLINGMGFDLSWVKNGATVATIRIRTGLEKIFLSYRYRCGEGVWKLTDYAVGLDRTPCNYGGQRAWFFCPAVGCDRRVAKLYLGGAGIFACRHCSRLAYECQREADDYRAMRRADRIRGRLGWGPGILNECGGKPKRMHWETFARLSAQHQFFACAAMAGHERWIMRFRKSIG